MVGGPARRAGGLNRIPPFFVKAALNWDYLPKKGFGTHKRPERCQSLVTKENGGAAAMEEK